MLNRKFLLAATISAIFIAPAASYAEKHRHNHRGADSVIHGTIDGVEALASGVDSLLELPLVVVSLPVAILFGVIYGTPDQKNTRMTYRSDMDRRMAVDYSGQASGYKNRVYKESPKTWGNHAY